MPDILLALVPLSNENCESESCELKDAVSAVEGSDMCGGAGSLNVGSCDGDCGTGVGDCGKFEGTFEGTGKFEGTGDLEGTGGNSEDTGVENFETGAEISEVTRAPCSFGFKVAGDISSECFGFLGTLGNSLRFAGILTARGLGGFVTNLASRPFLNTGSSGGRSLMLSWPP